MGAAVGGTMAHMNGQNWALGALKGGLIAMYSASFGMQVGQLAGQALGAATSAAANVAAAAIGGFAGGAMNGALTAAANGGNVWKAALTSGLIAAGAAAILAGITQLNKCALTATPGAEAPRKYYDVIGRRPANVIELPPDDPRCAKITLIPEDVQWKNYTASFTEKGFLEKLYVGKLGGLEGTGEAFEQLYETGTGKNVPAPEPNNLTSDTLYVTHNHNVVSMRNGVWYMSSGDINWFRIYNANDITFGFRDGHGFGVFLDDHTMAYCGSWSIGTP
jgi:hypothetical protein